MDKNTSAEGHILRNALAYLLAGLCFGCAGQGTWEYCNPDGSPCVECTLHEHESDDLDVEGPADRGLGEINDGLGK